MTKADQNVAQLHLLLEYVAADNEAANLLPTYCQNGSDMSFVGQEPAQNGQAGCKALEE